MHGGSSGGPLNSGQKVSYFDKKSNKKKIFFNEDYDRMAQEKFADRYEGDDLRMEQALLSLVPEAAQLDKFTYFYKAYNYKINTDKFMTFENQNSN